MDIIYASIVELSNCIDTGVKCARFKLAGAFYSSIACDLPCFARVLQHPISVVDVDAALSIFRLCCGIRY